MKATLAAVSACILAVANAQAQETRPVVSGSPDVLIGGAPAARAGDKNTGGAPIATGSTSVFVNGRPVGVTGSRTGCGGVVIGGGANVFIGGAPAARAGDPTTGCR